MLNIKSLLCSLLALACSFASHAKLQQVMELPCTQVVYVTEQGTLLASNLLEDFSGGIFYSVDQGSTWTESDAIDYNYSKFIEFDGDIYALGSGCILAKSSDDGRTWTYVDYSATAEPYAPKGYIEGCVCYGAAVKGDRLYVADLYCGIMYTEDKGETWVMTDRESITYRDQFGEFIESVYGLVTFKDKVYALGLYSVFCYDEDNDKWEYARGSNCMSVYTYYHDMLVCGRAIANDDENADFLLSTTDGVDWTALKRPDGLIDNYVRALAADDNNIYVGMLNKGIYFTPDLGETWYDISEGLPLEKYGYYFTINLAQDEDYLYAAIYHYDNTDMQSGVYRIAKADLPVYTPAEQPVTFAVSPSTETYSYGFEKKESFDVGISIKDPDLTGAKITAIRIPIQKDAQVTDAGYSAWISTALTVKANVFTPDVLKVPATVEGDWAVATLDEPYTITADGVYVGYSFAMSAIDTDADRRPLILTNAPFGENNLYVHTSHTYRSWQNLGEGANTSSAMQVVLDGASLMGDAAAFADADVIYAEMEKENQHTITVVNKGNTPISDVAYSYSIDAQEYTGNVTFDTPIGCDFYGEKREIELTIPALGISDGIDCSFAIDKVNGKDNNDRIGTISPRLVVLPFVTKHRPMVEEYTGLWCGYCPTGYVGMKMLSEHIGDDVVIVSIHNGDPMEVLAPQDYPLHLEGYPEMWFDRTAQTDPFFGDNLNNMYGLDNMWRRYSQKLAPCDIDLSASYDDDSQTSVTVKADVRFLNTDSNAPYRVGFYLVADDLSNPTWLQTNYYSTGTNSLPIEMSLFTNGDAKVAGLHFDDVLAAYSDVKGIEGSLPESIVSCESYPVTYSFDIKDNKVIQDKANVKAIAFVVNSQTGHIENANVTQVSGDGAGIFEITGVDRAISGIEYYDLNGIRLSRPAKGINIAVIRYTDGSRAIKKFYN